MVRLPRTISLAFQAFPIFQRYRSQGSKSIDSILLVSFIEVRGIVAKTIGAIPFIAEAFRKIEGVEEAFLYGSFARNQQDAASDIDVLAVGKPPDEALAEVARKLERQLGREINCTVLTRKELNSRRARNDAFLENVWHNKRVSLVAADEKTKTAQS
jgi:predicted nucleotidyltransferase